MSALLIRFPMKLLVHLLLNLVSFSEIYFLHFLNMASHMGVGEGGQVLGCFGMSQKHNTKGFEENSFKGLSRGLKGVVLKLK